MRTLKKHTTRICDTTAKMSLLQSYSKGMQSPSQFLQTQEKTNKQKSLVWGVHKIPHIVKRPNNLAQGTTIITFPFYK